MTTTLITGANKGLGRETARQLIEKGHTVYIGARSVEGGEAAAAELGARFVPLDITDDASVRDALRIIEEHEGRLDVLIDNAGVANLSERHESHDPFAVYGATKAAVSMLTVQYAKAVPEIRFNAAEPGFTATGFTAAFGGGRPVEESAEVIVRLATIGKDGPTGTFQEKTGELAW
jgi:NAD(P)-dependent dehydrogenase (short-subunit alcohol dehydrogenase family)